MKRILLFLLVILFLPGVVSAASFKFQKLRESVYAAIAEPGGKAASNSLIIISSYQVILAGSHFVPETTRELIDFVKTVTPIPVRYIILTHHHRGFNYVDFNMPSNAEIITSGPTWQSLKSEFRQIRNQGTFFDKNLTMQRGAIQIVLSATERGHSEGDVFVYLPAEGVLFTSDLFFNDVAGYMGDGTFRDWVGTLEILSGMEALTVVPGLGSVTNTEGIMRFQTFFRAFTTEILRLIGKGLEIEGAKQQFSLPLYDSMPGFAAFFDVNFRRAFNELKNLK